MSRARMVYLLAAVAAMSPLAIDLYLPAIPLIAADFGVSADKIAVTVSIYMLGLAGGQLVGGPLSDRIGRRPVMIFGQLLYALASLMMVFSDSWQLFWGLRLVQAIGGGMMMVCIPATIRDVSEGAESARLMASIALIMIAAPAVAPSIGSLMLAVSNWQLMFAFLAVYASLMAVAVYFQLPPRQSAPPKRRQSLLMGYWEVLSDRRAMGYMLAHSCAFSVMLIFVTNASYVYLEHFALGNASFSALFACNIAAMAVMNRVNVFWLRKHEPEQLAWRGVGLQGIAVAGLLLATLLADSLVLTAVFVIAAIGAQGAIAANTNASALRYFKHNSGVASATLGSLQFTLSAVISAFSTRFQGTGQLWPMALVMVACVTCGLWGLWQSRRHSRTVEGREHLLAR